MVNPILQQIRSKASGNSILSMIRGGNPTQVFNNMMQSNPQFQQFVQANKGKTIQQIAQENGIPMSTIANMMRGTR